MRIRTAARRLAALASRAALAGALLAAATPAAGAPGEASAKGDEKKPAPDKGQEAKPGASNPGATPPKAEEAKPEAKPAAKGKPAAKPAPRQKPAPKAAPKKGAPKRTRKPGEPGEPDEATRRIISGAPAPIGSNVRESPELKAMRDIDLALFPGAAPGPGPAWPADGTLLLDAGEPRLDASGLPPSGLLPAAPPPEPIRDTAWLRQLEMPDIPVRWDARVVRYLEYYRDDPRGRSAVTIWMKKSGRYGAAIRRVLRDQGLPEDILWLSLVESGFDPAVHSPAGAAGLWQFMPEGARIYGLTVDRWVDERLDPERSTLAAARYLADLRQRFGGWELAFAAYNMGYGGLLASIRKYNTNDFWELSRLEAGMPLETALYVPKIISIAIVARNKKVFGCDGVELDPAVTFDKVSVGSGVSLHSIAAASGAGAPEIEALNPQLVARRTPPAALADKAAPRWEIRVPAGAGARAAKSLPRVLDGEPKLVRWLVRWGESLDDIAAHRGVSRSSLQALNGLRSGEAPRPGTLLFVPAAPGTGAAAAEHLVAEGPPARPLIVAPAPRFSYADRRRVFYRVVAGDTLRDVAAALGVPAGELSRWNLVDPGAALHEGMTLQAFLPADRRPQGVLLLEEADARVLEVGSEAFFAHFEGLKGRKRVEITVQEGDTFRSLARRHGLSAGMLERITHRSRTTELRPGEKIVVYVPASRPTEPAAPPEPAVVAAPAAAAAADDGVRPASLRVDVADEPARPADPAGAPAEPPAAEVPAEPPAAAPPLAAPPPAATPPPPAAPPAPPAPPSKPAAETPARRTEDVRARAPVK
ncbi:MAG: transglycosylase SLT domain-containing protein [Polyangiaceae bacterium]|nr:transglycosylase SLT domain-containing protein [Polyangiaceae bacterium]